MCTHQLRSCWSIWSKSPCFWSWFSCQCFAWHDHTPPPPKQTNNTHTTHMYNTKPHSHTHSRTHTHTHGLLTIILWIAGLRCDRHQRLAQCLFPVSGLFQTAATLSGCHNVGVLMAVGDVLPHTVSQATRSVNLKDVGGAGVVRTFLGLGRIDRCNTVQGNLLQGQESCVTLYHCNIKKCQCPTIFTKCESKHSLLSLWYMRHQTLTLSYHFHEHDIRKIPILFINVMQDKSPILSVYVLSQSLVLFICVISHSLKSFPLMSYHTLLYFPYEYYQSPVLSMNVTSPSLEYFP